MAATAEIKIDAGIKMPGRPAGRGNQGSKYPLAQMSVGDSFLIPSSLSVGSVRSLAYSKQFTKYGKFSVRQTSEGFRCWRIS